MPRAEIRPTVPPSVSSRLNDSYPCDIVVCFEQGRGRAFLRERGKHHVSKEGMGLSWQCRIDRWGVKMELGCISTQWYRKKSNSFAGTIVLSTLECGRFDEEEDVSVWELGLLDLRTKRRARIMALYKC